MAPLTDQELLERLYFGVFDAQNNTRTGIGLANMTHFNSGHILIPDVLVFDEAFNNIYNKNAAEDDDLKLFLKSYFKATEQQVRRMSRQIFSNAARNTLVSMLNGERFPESGKVISDSKIANLPPNLLKRAFIADLLWLFYFEQMGIFKILGVILDDFDTKGKYPISAFNPTTNILQGLIMLTKMGFSSTVRDRASAYQRCLGWTTDVGKKLNIESQINNGFTQNFHKFIQYTLEYYKAKQLAYAIQTSGTTNRVSAATLSSISETIDLIKQSYKQFDYGDNHITTVVGIAWAIVGMYLVDELKNYLGISYTSVPEYMTSAYLSLVEGKPATISDSNRYTVHKECAESGRDILLSMETLKHKNLGDGEDLQVWLNLMEPKIERYRTAYRNLTGVDLGAPGTPKIEQQA